MLAIARLGFPNCLQFCADEFFMAEVEQIGKLVNQVSFVLIEGSVCINDFPQ